MALTASPPGPKLASTLKDGKSPPAWPRRMDKGLAQRFQALYSRRVRIGTFSLSLENRPAALDPRRGFRSVIELAQLADKSPFAAVWANDSLVDTPGFEPMVTLGAVAAVTSRVRIGTGILQAHFRNPALLALEWATLDHASGGRTILGLGVGGGTPEHLQRECELAGIRSNERGEKLERALEVLGRAWAGSDPTLQLPVVPLQTRVPVWLASGIYIPQVAEAGAQGLFAGGQRDIYRPGKLGRVARLADGWLTLMATPDEIRSANQRLDELCRECGRDPSAVTRALEVWINVGRTREAAVRETHAAIRTYFDGAEMDPETMRRWVIAGEPAECRERIAEFVAAGVQHFKLVIGSDDVLSQASRLVTEVVERLDH